MTPQDQAAAFAQGVIEKCAQYGVDPELMAKEAGLPLAFRLALLRVKQPYYGVKRLVRKFNPWYTPPPTKVTTQVMSIEEAMKRMGESNRRFSSTNTPNPTWTPVTTAPKPTSVYTQKFKTPAPPSQGSADDFDLEPW